MILSDGDRLTIADAGNQALGSWEPLPTGSALIDYWRARLGKAERSILKALAEAYPDALTKEEVAAKAAYEANGGGFNNALGRLITLELVQGRGELRASDNLLVSVYPAEAEAARQGMIAAMDRIARELQPSGYLVGDRFTVADLTAAALLWPLVMPKEFPYKLPTKLPAPFAKEREQLAGHDAVTWAADLYRNHRGRSATVSDETVI